MWYIHAMEYYSALESGEILTQATAWANHEDIMLMNKPDTKGQAVYGSTYVEYLKASGS